MLYSNTSLSIKFFTYFPSFYFFALRFSPFLFYLKSVLAVNGEMSLKKIKHPFGCFFLYSYSIISVG